MFSYIKGELAEVFEGGVVVEAGQIGWNISVPVSVLDRLPRIGSEVKIFTSFQVREDAMTLYGFLSRQDQRMFEELLGVSGIGPKAALGILSSLTPDDLRLAILSEDARAIAKAPGVGPKTAKRIILDLKDRVKAEDVLPAMVAGAGGAGAQAAGSLADGAAREAAEALVALGYSASEAMKAVRQVERADEMTAEAVLKASLKYLAF
ncbi:MAG: Holliday junction branch migration protein RuvA [Clostridiales bacterium]|nr:Holliday junction branch migration protein RuvA [Clostridiales bacterium]